MAADTRQDRHQMRQRGAGARDLKTASFGFDFTLFSPAKPSPSKTFVFQAGKYVVSDTERRCSSVTLPPPPKRRKPAVLENAPETAHIKTSKQRVRKLKAYEGQTTTVFTEWQPSSEENLTAESPSAADKENTKSKDSSAAKFRTSQAKAREPFTQLQNESLPTKRRKCSASTVAKVPTEASTISNTSSLELKPEPTRHQQSISQNHPIKPCQSSTDSKHVKRKRIENTDFSPQASTTTTNLTKPETKNTSRPSNVSDTKPRNPLPTSAKTSRAQSDWERQDWFKASVPASLQHSGDSLLGKVKFRF